VYAEQIRALKPDMMAARPADVLTLFQEDRSSGNTAARV
jgi:hypothetical protein